MSDSTTRKQSKVPYVIIAILLLIIGGYLALQKYVPGFSVSSKTEDSRSMNSISLDEQLVLMSLGVQGIKEHSSNSEFFGFTVPGSSRASWLQYEFSAKVGINGNDVEINEVAPGKVEIHIPRFIFIGHDDVAFKLVTEDNGLLSWITPEIDKIEMTNVILNDETQNEHLTKNKEILRHQAQTYLSSIITSVDPEAELEFVFSE